MSGPDVPRLGHVARLNLAHPLRDRMSWARRHARSFDLRSQFSAAILFIAATALGGCGERPEQREAIAVPCVRPYVYDGDYIRCDGFGRSRLYGIDAPEMPGACRPGRTCVPGDPYDSRDNLRALVAKGNIMCRQLDTDRYGRPVLQCWNEAGDLSCQQVAAGQAVPRYGRLECPPSYQSRSPE